MGVLGKSNNIREPSETEALIVFNIFCETDEIVLYPNPADNRAEIYKPLIDEVEVFNLLGTRIDHIDANRQKVVLDVSQYDNGVYLVHVRCLNNDYYKKLVIQR